MSTYTVVIHSTGRESEWTRAFVKEITEKGGDARQIASYASFREAHVGQQHIHALNELERAGGNAQIIIELLLHPEQHDHYLRDVAQLYRRLAANERVILVYDASQINQAAHMAGHRAIVDQITIQLLLDDLRKVTVNADTRILSRKQAIDMLIKTVPLS